MKIRSCSRLIAFALLTVMLVSFSVAAQEKSAGEEKYDKLIELADMIKSKNIYAKPGDDPIKKALIKMFDEYPEMFGSFVNTMFQSYDKNSYYMSAEQHEAGFNLDKVTGGAGIVMEMRDDGVYIIQIVAGSGAEKAGAAIGDKLLTIDGRKLDRMTVDMIGELIRGEVGSEFELAVQRGSEQKKFNIKRSPLPVSTISARIVSDGVGYIKIASFNGISTYMDFVQTCDTMKEKGVDTVIYDVRDNPGGDVDCLVNMTEQVITQKKLPYLMIIKTNPMSVRTIEAAGIGWKTNKSVILVNGKTASSAEAFAGTLQDLGYADLVGEKTYGKGLGQEHIALPDKSYAVISTSELALPITGRYNGVGITPKFEVKIETHPYEMPALTPLVLEKGVYRAQSINVRGVEERLRELGFFDGKPDDTADEITFFYINRFQRANDI
ncbi:MAG: S41 family peptidase, partial [Clostridia bacterium]